MVPKHDFTEEAFIANDKNYQVLIVDDDKWICRVISHYITKWGYKPLIANDPIEGLAIAIKHRPIVIFLDIFMPEISGYTVLKLLKKIEYTSEIPVIIISGNLSRELLGSSYKHGAAGFVSKPISESLLYEKFNQVLTSDITKLIEVELSDLSTEEITEDKNDTDI